VYGLLLAHRIGIEPMILPGPPGYPGQALDGLSGLIDGYPPKPLGLLPVRGGGLADIGWIALVDSRQDA